MYKDPKDNEFNYSYNEDAIKQALRNIIYTLPGELPGDPEFGTNIKKMVFVNYTPTTETEIRNELTYAIEKYEPRITLQDIIINFDDIYNKLHIKIEYTLNKDLHDDYSSKFVVFTFER